MVVIAVVAAIALSYRGDDSDAGADDSYVATESAERAESCRSALSDSVAELESIGADFDSDNVPLEQFQDAVDRADAATSNLGSALVGPCSDQVAAQLKIARDQYANAFAALEACFPDCDMSAILLSIDNAKAATSAASGALGRIEDLEADYLRDRTSD